MHVKKIRMVGFKSFADETVIEPGAGITAIVGPNGCGKSNIVDAVRWVLGEKSGRALRGKNMEDVIFLGSEKRKQSGMAEVEIHFDNLDRSLSVDQDEVSIGRRLYLNSASEYILNGKRTTRKEIERVLMDTGIGKTAYSIMEQGRMSEILRASPEDRRLLFDEAAGISRFKAERQETLKRLDDTEQNLLRLGDILKEKEKELENLERQARKTRQYLKLKEHLDKHDKNVRYLKWSDHAARLKAIEDKLEKLAQKKQEILDRIEKSETEAEQLEVQNQDDLEKRHALDRQYHQTLSVIESLQKGQQRVQQEIDERSRQKEQIQERLTAEDKFLKASRKKLEQSMQLELDLSSEIDTLTQKSAELQKVVEQLEVEVQEFQKKEEANHTESQQIEKDQKAVMDQLRALTEQLINDLEARKKDIEAAEKSRKALSDEMLARIQEGKATVDTLIKDMKAAAETDLSAKKAGWLQSVESLSFATLLKDFDQYQKLDAEFRSLFFGESGLISRKEELDQKMNRFNQRKVEITKENQEIQQKRKQNLTRIEKEKNRRVEIELQIRDYQARRDSSQEARDQLENQIEQSSARLAYLNDEIKSVDQTMAKLQEEQKQQSTDLERSNKETRDTSAKLESMQKNIEKVRDRIASLREKTRKDRDSIERLLPEVSREERAQENISVAQQTLEEELYNDFQMSPGELEAECGSRRLNKEQEQSEFRRIKGEIQGLGQFNALAIDEYARCEEALNELLKQKQDIEDARKNILSILQEIDENSRALFKDTFERIQNNFTEVFQTLFNGGHASLTLTDENDPMNSGVSIMVQPPGKKNTSITLLSGGEQNMTAIALMFATYLVRPSPFCLLDEIDAPLDDNNVHRFLKMLASFAPRSQFLVITHNKLTMEKAGAIFGVTQEEAGVTRIVSVRFQDRKQVVS
ncbi:MAG: AAA family ATPase [Leptospiraceae bacterium]|nr:AAA family ATPase [Leptospiraceae bacterium]